MTTNSATKRVIKNASVGILLKLLTILFTFINRTLFIKVLGEQYLGINGLYSNILAVLSLADLGVNSVLMFFLYEPLVHKDEQKLVTLITYFKKVYNIIAISIFVIGLALIPFLPSLVTNTRLTYSELVVYYLLFLINTCCSYLAIYKSTILVADQLAYVVNTVNFTFTVVQSLVQIFILYITEEYAFYLIVAIACTLGNNILLTILNNKRYPFLKTVLPEKNISGFKRKILSNIKNVFLYRIGGTIMNSTDNILISVLIGTSIVGYYSNYTLIVTNLMLLLMFFSQAIMSAMGNFGVDADSDRRELVFRTVMLIYAVIAAFMCGCIVSMMNDFMIFWLGDGKYVLSQSFVFVLTAKLFVDIITSPNWTFRESAGLFKEVRLVMFVAAVLNLILSVLFEQIIGLAGIIIATSAAKILTLFWYEPRTFYRKIFKKPLLRYWSYEMRLIIMAVASIALSFGLSNLFSGSLIGMVVKIVISAISTIIVFGVLGRNTEEFRFCINKIRRS